MNSICSHSRSTWAKFDKRFPVCNTDPPGMLSGRNCCYCRVVRRTRRSSVHNIYLQLLRCAHTHIHTLLVGSTTACHLVGQMLSYFSKQHQNWVSGAFWTLSRHLCTDLKLENPAAETNYVTSGITASRCLPPRLVSSRACFTKAAQNTWWLHLISHYCYLF